MTRKEGSKVAYSAPNWVYSPNRLKTPLRRVGERGEGKFEAISWDEAITIIADTLKEQKERYGPESLAVLGPARPTYSVYFNRLPSFPLCDGGANVQNLYNSDIKKATDPVVWAIASQTLVEISKIEAPQPAAAPHEVT